MPTLHTSNRNVGLSTCGAAALQLWQEEGEGRKRRERERERERERGCAEAQVFIKTHNTYSSPWGLFQTVSNNEWKLLLLSRQWWSLQLLFTTIKAQFKISASNIIELYLPNKRRFWNSCALSKDLTIASLSLNELRIISKSWSISSNLSLQTGQLRDAYLQSCKQKGWSISSVSVCVCVCACVCVCMCVCYYL